MELWCKPRSCWERLSVEHTGETRDRLLCSLRKPSLIGGDIAGCIYSPLATGIPSSSSVGSFCPDGGLSKGRACILLTVSRPHPLLLKQLEA